MRIMVYILVFLMSICVSFGDCVAAEIDAADYLQDAKNGNPISQFYLAYGYTYGIWGLEADEKKASYWLQKAIEGEDIDATCLMGSKLLKQSKELLNSDDDEKRKLGLEAYTTGRSLLEEVARLGHPSAFLAISPLFAGEGKYVMALAWILLFQQRMRDFAALVANTEPLKAIFMQKMTEEEIAKAQADADYLDEKLPICLPEDYYIEWPQGIHFCDESEMKKLAAEACKMFRELVKAETDFKPEINFVNRSVFATRLRKEFDGSLALQNRETQNAYDQAVYFALSRIGYYFSTGELYIVPGTIPILFSFAGVEKEKQPSYFKLFIIGEIARKYFADKIKLVSENDENNYEARSIILESLVLFCQLRFCEKLGCDQGLIKSGLFFYHTKFPENTNVLVKETLKPGLRFLNYLQATFSEENLWNVSAYLPQTISEIKRPELIKTLFDQTLTDNVQDLFANAVKQFEAENYHQAKANLRSIFFKEPLHGQARFLLAVINAREKKYTAAWINGSIAKQSLATDQKLISFMKKLKSIAPEFYCEF